jgi:hypothetical protein
MELSKTSTHYRLVRYVFGEEYFTPTLSLCKYFWTCILSFLISPTVFIVRHTRERLADTTVLDKLVDMPSVEINIPHNVAVGLILGALAAMTIAGLYFAFWLTTAVLIMIGVFIAVGLGIVKVSTFIADIMYERRKNRRDKDISRYVIKGKEKKKRLWWEYLMARKQKICPLISWKEDLDDMQEDMR